MGIQTRARLPLHTVMLDAPGTIRPFKRRHRTIETQPSDSFAAAVGQALRRVRLANCRA